MPSREETLKSMQQQIKFLKNRMDTIEALPLEPATKVVLVQVFVKYPEESVNSDYNIDVLCTKPSGFWRAGEESYNTWEDLLTVVLDPNKYADPEWRRMIVKPTVTIEGPFEPHDWTLL